jgi:hypothetical protein
MLKKQEHGAITKQSRELWFEFDLELEDGTKIDHFSQVDIKITGGGDGVGGASLNLRISNRG